MKDDTDEKEINISFSPAPLLMIQNTFDSEKFEKPSLTFQGPKKGKIDNNKNQGCTDNNNQGGILIQNNQNKLNNIYNIKNQNNNSIYSLNESGISSNPFSINDNGPVEAIEFENENENKKGPNNINNKVDIQKKRENNNFDEINVNIKGNCKINCFKRFNRSNVYHFELISIINLMNYIIWLAIFLIFFIDYSDNTFKGILPLSIIYINILVVGVVFVLTKFIQYKKNYENKVIPIIFIIILKLYLPTFFLSYFSYYEIGKEGFEIEDSKTINLIYVTHHIFSIIYCLTVTIFIVKEKAINFLWFYIIGFIYAIIATISTYYISKNGQYRKDGAVGVGAILYFSEIISFNSGIGIAFCRKALDENYIAWSILHIEIYSIYPFIIISTFPVIIIAALLACCVYSSGNRQIK